MKILFIGNSYTFYNDMPKMFEAVANENGKDVTVFSVTKGGRKLYEYVDTVDEYSEQLDELLNNHKFDICFIQEYSTLSVADNALFMDGLTRLVEKVKNSVDKFVLYETWGSKDGHPAMEALGMTTEEMAMGIAHAYKKAGEEIGAQVSYAGLNFLDVYKNHKEIEIYDADLKHPSYEGSCLSMLTHYKTIFNELPKSTDSLSLSENQLSVFKEIVSKNLTV